MNSLFQVGSEEGLGSYFLTYKETKLTLARLTLHLGKICQLPSITSDAHLPPINALLITPVIRIKYS